MSMLDAMGYYSPIVALVCLLILWWIAACDLIEIWVRRIWK